MVVAGILALALALPTGALFGIGYGTGVRIGYEQIYPLLFPANKDGTRNTQSTVENVKAINQIYDAIGGKEASQMGIAVGLSSAMSELDKNPDFRDLLKLESTLSGNTSESLEWWEQTGGIQTVSDRGLTSQQGDSSSSPASFLDNPLIIIPEDFGPENIVDTFGYGKMSRGQLLDNQPSQLKQRPSNIVERQTNWNFYYNKLLNIDVKATAIEQEKTKLQQQKIGTSVFTSADPTNVAKTAYVVKRGELLTILFRAKFDLDASIIKQKADLKDPKTGAVRMATNTKIVNSLNTKITNAKKAVLSFITQARNVGHTKSLANTDWNNRIWQI